MVCRQQAREIQAYKETKRQRKKERDGVTHTHTHTQWKTEWKREVKWKLSSARRSFQVYFPRSNIYSMSHGCLSATAHASFATSNSKRQKITRSFATNQWKSTEIHQSKSKTALNSVIDEFVSAGVFAFDTSFHYKRISSWPEFLWHNFLACAFVNIQINGLTPNRVGPVVLVVSSAEIKRISFKRKTANVYCLDWNNKIYLSYFCIAIVVVVVVVTSKNGVHFVVSGYLVIVLFPLFFDIVFLLPSLRR